MYNHEPACRVIKEDKNGDGDKENGDEDEDEGEDEDEDESGDEKNAPILCFGPPKRHSRLGYVKSVIRHDHQDAADDMDLSKLQSPKIPVPANGSSQSTGGDSRGCAFGIALNIGDPFDMQQEVRPLSRGRINYRPTSWGCCYRESNFSSQSHVTML